MKKRQVTCRFLYLGERTGLKSDTIPLRERAGQEGSQQYPDTNLYNSEVVFMKSSTSSSFVNARAVTVSAPP
jgi:hypothetical protein